MDLHDTALKLNHEKYTFMKTPDLEKNTTKPHNKMKETINSLKTAKNNSWWVVTGSSSRFSYTYFAYTSVYIIKYFARPTIVWSTCGFESEELFRPHMIANF